MGACVTTTASDVSDSNDGETFGKSGLPRAGFGKLRMWSVPNRKLILQDFFKFVCK